MKTFKQFLVESENLNGWPKTVEEVQERIDQCWLDDNTGEVFFDKHKVKINKDLTVDASTKVIINMGLWSGDNLPFKFGQVSGELIIDCAEKQIHSLEGCPKYARSFALLESKLIRNLKGMPTEVSDYVQLKNCDGLVSLDGLSPDFTGELDLNYCNSVTDFSAIPKKLEQCQIHSNGFTETSFKYLPSVTNSLSIYGAYDWNMSLIGFHKFVKECSDLSLGANRITDGGISLLKIKGLKDVFYNDFEFYDNGGDIIAKYLPEGDILECQQELIDGGFDKAAKL